MTPGLGLAAGRIALVGEDVAIAVAVVDGDPAAGDRAVDAALEVGIADVEEMDALQRAARLHPVADENSEDLAAGFVVGQRLWHGDTW